MAGKRGYADYFTISIDKKLLELKEIIANNVHNLPHNETKPESQINTPPSK